MKLAIKNIDLGKVISFLEKTNFKGMQSVNRSKVTHFLREELRDVAKGEETIREDGKDKPKQWLIKELETYFEQTVTVEGTNYLAGLTAIKNKIKDLIEEESEHEFGDEDAYALFVLYQAFELDKKGDDK